MARSAACRKTPWPLPTAPRPSWCTVEATWQDPADTERCIAWARDAWATLRRFGAGGLYPNFAGFGEEKNELARAAFGSNYDRLVELKTKYDPDNLFHINLNIPPQQVAVAAD